MYTILTDYYSIVRNNDTESIRPIIDMNSELIPEFLRFFKYPISSWPIILNDEMKSELEEISSLVPNILNQILRLYFNSDVSKIAEFYFDGDVEKAKYAIKCVDKQSEISSRLDLVYSTEGFRLLEVNMGSSLGGMEFENFEPLIKSLHPSLVNSSKESSFRYRKTQSIYLSFLIDKMLKLTTQKTMHIYLLSHQNELTAELQQIRYFFEILINQQPVLKQINKEVKVHMGHKDSLSYNGDNLLYNSSSIHAVISLDFSIDTFSSDIYDAYFKDQIYFIDHIGTSLLRDKRNLAILRDLALKKKFQNVENQLVLKYIPWTEIVSNKEIQFKNERINLFDLILSNKDEFVLKIADGLQGTEVYVGKFHSQADWELVVNSVQKSKKFIVQHFVPSKEFLAPNKDNNWVAHQIVWGGFSIGNNYAGTWGRMTSSTKSNKGVINSATGAVEVIAYEAQ